MGPFKFIAGLKLGRTLTQNRAQNLRWACDALLSRCVGPRGPPWSLLGPLGGLLRASGGASCGLTIGTRGLKTGPRGLQMSPQQQTCGQAASNSQFDRFYDAQKDEHANLLNNNICILRGEVQFIFGICFLLQASIFDGVKHNLGFCWAHVWGQVGLLSWF